jgi:hypothetical protein
MTADEFKDILATLGWKQSDFCAKAGVNRDTPSRWSNGHTPIPDWVPAYLGAILDIERLHAKYVSTRPYEALLAKDLASLSTVRVVPMPRQSWVDESVQELDPDWVIKSVDRERRHFVLVNLDGPWVLPLDFDQVVRLTRDLDGTSKDQRCRGILELNCQVEIPGRGAPLTTPLGAIAPTPKE